MIESFKDLVVWQHSIQLAKDVYRLTARFPNSELFGMTSQLRRASVSISANLAEGHGRGSRRDYARFVSIALGSAREVDSLLHLAEELEFVQRTETINFRESLDHTSRMLGSLRRNLENG